MHDNAKAVPAFEGGVGEDGFDDLEREFQTVGFLGVDVQAKTCRAGKPCEGADAGHQFVHDLRAFGDLVARVEGGEFHRNAGVGADVASGGRAGDGGDGAGIGQVVAVGVSLGAGGFAQHVIAVGAAFGLQIAGAVHGGVDGFTQDKGAAHFLHGAGDGGADHRLSQPAHGGAQVADHAGFAVVQHFAGQHERPCGGIDERRGGAAKVAAPVGGGDLVLDQRVHRGGVGDAQQGFGQTHQGDAFVGGKAIFGEEHLHQPGLGGGADRRHQSGGA